LTRTDLDIEAVRRAGSGRVVGCRVLYHRALDSTMDEARRLAADGAPDGTVVIAEEQTAGRGRLGRPWVSAPGRNLSLSVVLQPSTAQLRYVNMAATLAVSGAIADLTGLAPAVKWPNDVMIDGRKVSGILVESSVAGGGPNFAVVGIGLNVNLDPSAFPEIESLATSLLRETGAPLDRTAVLLALLSRLDSLYGDVRRGRSLTDEWADRLETLGRSVRVRWGDRLLEGRATGVDEDGNLLLAQPDGSTVTVVAGEVTLQV
jgi:BirA family biotin operon repressor/biotin-[acetyl-CoA-carboxylase] ligase